MKRCIIFIMLLTLISHPSFTMDEEQRQLEEAMRLSMQPQYASSSSSAYPTIRTLTAMQESEKTLAQEQEKILPAGVYQKNVPNVPVVVNQLALQGADRQVNENITCGPRILFIAQALCALVVKLPHTSINPHTLHNELDDLNYAAKTNPARCKKQMASTNIDRYMERNKIELSSFFVLGSQGNEVVPLETSRTNQHESNILTTVDLSNQLEKSVSPELGNNVKDIYFMCVDAAAQHWFLITVIRRNIDSNTEIWYIDPKNTDVEKYPYAHKFITYIYEHLVKPAAHE